MPDYIKQLRDKVGKNKVFLNFAVACISDDSGRLLLQKRAEKRNAWGFPGGAMELGESAEETVIREVQEETGLLVRVDNLLGVYTKYEDVYPNGDCAQPIVIVFFCSIVGGRLNSDSIETEKLCFFERDKIPRLFNKQHNEILDDFLAGTNCVYR